MPNNEQKKRKRPKMPTPEQIKMIKDYQKEHDRLMATDPEYREERARRKASLEKIALMNDSIERISLK